MNYLNNEKGYTLIELISVVIIISVITAPTLYLFYETPKETIANQRKINAQSEADTAMRLILEDLRKVETSKLNPADSTSPDTIQIGNIPTSVIVIRFSDTNQVAYGIFDKKLYRYAPNASINLLTLTPGLLSTTGGRILVRDVSQFNASSMTNGYQLSITVAPKAAGHYTIEPKTVTGTFTPRFSMNIR